MIPRKLQPLANEFREGIAEAIGVEPNEINPKIVEKWVKDWTKAFLTPKAFYKLWGEGSVKNSTKELVKHALSKKEEKKGGLKI